MRGATRVEARGTPVLHRSCTACYSLTFTQNTLHFCEYCSKEKGKHQKTKKKVVVLGPTVSWQAQTAPAPARVAQAIFRCSPTLWGPGGTLRLTEPLTYLRKTGLHCGSCEGLLDTEVAIRGLSFSLCLGLRLSRRLIGPLHSHKLDRSPGE